MARRCIAALAGLMLLALPGASTATHDAELIATGEGVKGWVAIRFYTDGAVNDPEPEHGYLDHAGMVILEITHRSMTTAGYLRAAPIGTVLDAAGAPIGPPVLITASGWNGSEVGARVEGPADPARAEASFDPLSDGASWGGEAKSSYYEYPQEPGEYVALMFVAGDVVRWRWRMFVRPGNNVRILGIATGNGGTHLLDGSDFTGPSVSASGGRYNPSVRVSSTAHIDATNGMYGLAVTGIAHTEFRLDAPNGSYDCTGEGCYFSAQPSAGRTTFTLSGVASNDRDWPLIAFAEARLP